MLFVAGAQGRIVEQAMQARGHRTSNAAAILIAMLWACFSASQARADGTPLFSSNSTLYITIEAPLRTIQRNAARSTDAHEGVLYLGEDESEAFPIAVSARGLTRRAAGICNFPPLRINFDRSERPLDGTVFEGQNRLKLVTHCQSSTRYQQYYILEYLAYRIYNELTPHSFRVRPLEVTYRDSEGNASFTRFGFFIEDVDDLAERNGLEEVEARGGVPFDRLDPDAAALGALFQYMIGNLDWDFAAGPAGEDCCHNARLIGRSETAPGLVPVPYDFDYSGLVDAPYAVPPAQFRMRSVTQRRYRGLCRFNDSLSNAVVRVFERQDAIMQLIEQETRLTGRTRRRAASYIQSFYQIVGDARDYQSSIVNRCN